MWEKKKRSRRDGKRCQKWHMKVSEVSLSIVLARLGIVHGTRGSHHPTHANHTSRTSARSWGGSAIGIVGIIEVYGATRLMGNSARLRRLFTGSVGHVLLPREVWNGGPGPHGSIVTRVFGTRTRVVHTSRWIIRIISRLLVGIRLEGSGMDSPLRDLREWSGRGLTRRPMGVHLVSMGTMNGQGHLVVEGLLLLGLGWIEMEGEGDGAFDISHRDGLLGARLVHGDWSRSALVSRVWNGHGHRGAKWRDPNGRAGWRRKTDNGLRFGGDCGSGVNRPRR